MEGKTALVTLGNKMLECLEKLGDTLRDSSTEMKITAMNSLSSLVKLDTEHQTEEMVSVTRTWCQHIPHLATSVTTVVRQPFLDLRLAAYQLILVMCGQEWGRKLIMSQPGN